MKGIVSILTENPFYFTIPLQERYKLVKRLMSKAEGKKEQPHDLSGYERKVSQFFQAEDVNLLKSFCWHRPVDQENGEF